MERLGNQKPSGMSANALRAWGMIILTLGTVGKCILQNHLAGMQNSTTQELLEWMSASEMNMGYATVAIVLQIVETCAVPLFAFLTLEGFKHTSNLKNYLLRVSGLALITEIPYNLAMSGSWLDMGSRNPVFSVVLCLVALYFLNRYSEKSFNNFVIKFFVTLAAFIWAEMLRLQFGAAMLLVTMALWACRNKPNFRTLVGSAAAIACSIFSPFYLASPMSFLAIHAYNEEPGNQNRLVNYLAYPVMLLTVALVGIFLF